MSVCNHACINKKKIRRSLSYQDQLSGNFRPREIENKIGNLAIKGLDGCNDEISVVSYIFNFENDQLVRNFADHS